MKKYYIYNADAEWLELLGTVMASSIEQAEIKAYKEIDTKGHEVFALTTAPDEPFA